MELKKGTIFKNLWAGYETYFVYQGTIKGKNHTPDKSYGYGITFFRGKWEIRKCDYLPQDLKNDREHFPIVGYVNIEDILTSAIFNAIQDGGKTDG